MKFLIHFIVCLFFSKTPKGISYLYIYKIFCAPCKVYASLVMFIYVFMFMLFVRLD